MSQEELEELLNEEEIDEIKENDEEEDSIPIVTESEAKRLKKLQDDFAAKNKKVQKSECVFVYEKQDEN